MAAYNAVSSSSSNGASSLTYSHTTGGANRSIVVSVCLSSRTVTATVTYAGVSMADLGHFDSTGAGLQRVYLFGLANPTTGANNVILTLSGSTEIYSGAVSATAADQSAGAAAFGTFAGATAVSTAPSVAVTSAASELVVDGVEYGNDRTAVGAGQTERWHLNPNSTWSGSGSTEAGAASVTMSWTVGATVAWTIAGVAIKNVGAAATSLSPPRRPFRSFVRRF